MNKFSICPDTGLRICEYFRYLLIREDGVVKNINPASQHKGKGWYKPSLNSKGYCTVKTPLVKKTELLSRLLALSFISNPLDYPIVDHIDGNPSNNTLGNLRWVSRRQNNSNCHKHRAGKLIGATYRSDSCWTSQIAIGGKKLHLGCFKSELEAHQAYLNKLSTIIS